MTTPRLPFTIIIFDHAGNRTELDAMTEGRARRIASEESKYESCARVEVPELALVIRGDYASFYA